MKSWVVSLVFAFLFIASGISSLVFYEYWQREQDQVIEVIEENKTLKTEIQALESNKDVNLNKVAEDFLNTLFLPGEDPEKHFEKLVNQTTGKAKTDFENARKTEDHGEGHDHEGVNTNIVVKDSLYNRESNKEAQVVVTFERTFENEGSKVKTLNEMKMHLVYVKDKWLVERFDMKELL